MLKDVRINSSLEQSSERPVVQHDEESVGVLNAEHKGKSGKGFK